jgi:uncharacterized membrane protein YdjX (TVP38/TMEM64 family)
MREKTGIEQLKSLNKKKLPDLDKYIIFSFAVMLVYTISELVLSSFTGISHDTLTTCIFAAFGGELLMCAMIKRLKLRRN